jgi:hypothetical protein
MNILILVLKYLYAGNESVKVFSELQGGLLSALVNYVYFFS